MAGHGPATKCTIERTGRVADRTFVDTNVLVYSLDPNDARKHAIAREVLDPASSHDLVISTQVLSEFYVVTTT
jgi:predicted nucleic acid-binding protein